MHDKLLDYEFLSYTSTNKACSASKYYSETLTLALILTLTRRYIISVRVRVCGTYLVLMRYWYAYTRKIHSPGQYIMHCGYLALWELGLSPSSILHVVKISAMHYRITYNLEQDQVRTMLITHNAWKTAQDYESLSYTSTNKACSASTYNCQTLTLTSILSLTLRYITVINRPYFANACSLTFCCKKRLCLIMRIIL